MAISFENFREGRYNDEIFHRDLASESRIP